MHALSSPSFSRLDVWRADELARHETPAVATGHAALDEQLPGGGWPLGALVELLPATPGTPAWPLLMPALAKQVREQGGVLVLVNPPHEPNVPALVAAGLPAEKLLWLRDAAPAPSLWAAEQALDCTGVTAVLTWLPQVRATDLRRLHAMARRHARALLFVLRPMAPSRAVTPSCAPLRLGLGLAERPRVSSEQGFGPWLRVDILKRRGPPLAAPLWLPAQGEPLARLLNVGNEAADKPAHAVVLPFPKHGMSRSDKRGSDGHALGRPAVAA